MSGVSWTKDQERVIRTHDRNLLVSAAAGSGKTAVLVQRIVDMVTDEENPMDVDELLVVTFTNAAASEMRERVADALAKLLDENPQNRHVKRQNTLIHQAQITTIDSFCLYVIRNYFNQLDIDPSFRIGDEGELRLLLADVMEEMLEEHYQKGDKDFADFVETYSRGKADSGIDEYIYQVVEFARSTPWPQKWMKACEKEIAVESEEKLEKTSWMAYLLEDVRRQAGELLGLVEEAKEICMEEDGPQPYLAAFLDDEILIKRIQGAETYQELSEILVNASSLTRLKAVRSKEVDPYKKEEASSIRTQVKQILTKMKKLYASGSCSDVVASMKGSQKAVLTLLSLAQEFEQRYQEAKKEKNLVDFSDLEHFAIQILLREGENGEIEPTEAAKQLSAQYREILIDEYQDSNLVQETLLNSISREREHTPNMFMVGDVKQSIYRFRLARPELFMKKYETYTTEESLYQKIELHQNFRSRREILESANQVFWKLMIRAVGGIAYTKEHALYPGADFLPLPDGENEAYRTELLLCDTTQSNVVLPDGNAQEEKILQDREEFTAKEAEAHMVAQEILRLTDPKTGMMVWDKKEKKYRRARYQDIAVLSRSMAGWAEIFTNVFMNCEIPAIAETRTGYFNTIEVETILSFLAVLDNPMQDIPLAAVMHSPIGNFSDTEMAELMASYKKMPQKGEDRGLYGAFFAALYGVSKKREQALETKIAKEIEGKEDATEWEIYETWMQEWDTQKEEEGNEVQEVETEEEIKEEIKEDTEKVFPNVSEQVRKKLEDLEELLRYFRKKAQYLPIHELLYCIYEETGYYRYVSAMPAGQVRAANLDMLAEKAAAYESTSYRGVFHFIRYIEKLKSYDTDFGEASLTGEEDNAVRMMSIHKSKGLEFPIVFLVGMAKKFNRMDLYRKVLIDPELGVAADYFDVQNRIRYTTLKKQVLKRRLEIENLGEELRVLYVAMTRAKEKLIMTAACSGMEKRVEKWAGKNRESLLFTTVASAEHNLDWILMSLSGDIQKITTQKGMVSFGWIDVRTILLEELVEGEVLQQAQRKLLKEELMQFDTKKEYSRSMRRQLEEVMGFQYPYEADITLHTKMAVSELKKMTYQMDTEEAAWLPTLPEFMKGTKAFSEEEDVDEELLKEAEKEEEKKKRMAAAAARGTMYHHVLELLPLEQITQEQREEEMIAWITQEIQRLCEMGRITQEESEIVEYRALARFLLSALGERMIKAAKAGKLYREKQFVMGIPAKEIPNLAESDELVVVQGIIDAWFVEDGQIILLDYKTDRIRRGQEDVLRERYHTQLEYYKKALQQMTGMQVKETWIYSIAIQQAIAL